MAAERDPARLGQGRHPGRVAGDHRHQRVRDAHRRLRRQSRRRAGRASADYTASYKGIGIASNVEFEVQYAAQGFDDVRAIGARTGLQSLMLGGNTSLALGTTPTPTPSGSTTGGALAERPWSVIVVALALDGVINGTVAGGIQSTVAAMSQKVATASAMVKCAMVRGAEAHRLGWTAHELFGVHPQSGTRRVDAGGVLMLGTGAAQSVRADRVSFAQTSGYRFLKGQTLGISIWESASKSRCQPPPARIELSP